VEDVYSVWSSAVLSQFPINVVIHHIRNTPNFVGRGRALSAALILRPNTRRVSAGSITPSSHSLSHKYTKSQPRFKHCRTSMCL